MAGTDVIHWMINGGVQLNDSQTIDSVNNYKVFLNGYTFNID